MDAQAKPSGNEVLRREWLGVLARAPVNELQAFWAALEPKPEFKELRPPEIGLVMARGRAGGTGAPFNFGEVAVTRCSLRLDNGLMGHGYTIGRDKDKARLIAIFDAMLQDPTTAGALETSLLQSLRKTQDHERSQRASRAAATKVDFFTMARES